MRLEGVVEKAWGGEYIFATNDLYCGKILFFKKDSCFSMHFHGVKDETWCVLQGKFEVRYINTIDSSRHSKILNEGDTWRNKPLAPHQLFCIEEGIIVEVSTPDTVEDNYRILPGDNQNV